MLPPLEPGASPRVVVSRSRPPDVAYDVTEALGGVMIPMGSAGAKIAAVILGAAEVYVHAGGQYEWDSCAPVAVAMASGLHASRLDGEPLRYGDPDAWLPDLVVCRREYADDRARRHDAAAPALLVGRRRPDPGRSLVRASSASGELTEPRLARRRGSVVGYFALRRQPMARTFAACSPLGPWLVSNSTFWPSSRLR